MGPHCPHKNTCSKYVAISADLVMRCLIWVYTICTGLSIMYRNYSKYSDNFTSHFTCSNVWTSPLLTFHVTKNCCKKRTTFFMICQRLFSGKQSKIFTNAFAQADLGLRSTSRKHTYIILTPFHQLLYT